MDLLALFAALALGFVALAIPLQLDRQWITVAWALEALAVWWLLDHLEDSAIPRAEAVDLAYELLAAADGRIPPPALRYLRRSGAPFRAAQTLVEDILDRGTHRRHRWGSGRSVSMPTRVIPPR